MSTLDKSANILHHAAIENSKKLHFKNILHSDYIV